MSVAIKAKRGHWTKGGEEGGGGGDSNERTGRREVVVGSQRGSVFRTELEGAKAWLRPRKRGASPSTLDVPFGVTAIFGAREY